jgi:hypothetical protein
LEDNYWNLLVVDNGFQITEEKKPMFIIGHNALGRFMWEVSMLAIDYAWTINNSE